MKVSSHEVRALATSTAFYGNTAMTEIMKAARWAQSTSFTTFYLRDVAQNMEGIPTGSTGGGTTIFVSVTFMCMCPYVIM